VITIDQITKQLSALHVNLSGIANLIEEYAADGHLELNKLTPKRVETSVQLTKTAKYSAHYHPLTTEPQEHVVIKSR